MIFVDIFSWKKLFSNKVLRSRSHYFINFEWVLGIEWFGDSAQCRVPWGKVIFSRVKKFADSYVYKSHY